MVWLATGVVRGLSRHVGFKVLCRLADAKSLGLGLRV